MKKIILVSFAAILLFACKKDNSNGANIPQWLKDKIAVSEANIKTNDKIKDAFGVWYRYTYEGVYYYEYINYLSSISHEVYNASGSSVFTSNIENYQQFKTGKCCDLIIWKGPQFPENF